MNTTSLRKAPLLRRGAVALLALGLALPGVVACDDDAPVTTAPETEQADESPEPAPSTDDDAPSTDDDSNAAIKPLPKESDAPAEEANEDAAYWDFPTSVDGWLVYTLDDDGINELYNNSSCTYMSAEYYYDDGADWADDDETQFQADSWVDFLEEEHGSVDSTQEVSTSVTDSDGNPVEMIKIDSQYTDDGKDVRNISWLRVFGTTDDYTIMMLSYACESDDIDEGELDDLVAITHIVNPGPAMMEDGGPGSSSSGSSTSKDDMV